MACLLTSWSLWYSLQTDLGFVAVVVIVIEIALFVAVSTGIGRRFAVGFIAMIISMGLATKGEGILLPWGVPVIMAYHAAKPVWRSAANIGADSRRRKAWLSIHSKEPPALAQGMILTNTVNECAARLRDNDTLNSYPRDGMPLSWLINCQHLSTSRASNDTSAARFTESDDGWRWRYTPAPPDSPGRISGYETQIFEDPVLGRASPRYASDAMGEIRELVAGKPATVVASPVESLTLLSSCIARVPAERVKEKQLPKAELEKLRWRVFWNPIDEVIRRCPELQGHVALDRSQQPLGVIPVSARGADGKPEATVGVYVVELIPVDAKQFVFEVSAWPRTSYGSNAGIRSYFVARDGSIHVTAGKKASAQDPLVSPMP